MQLRASLTILMDVAKLPHQTTGIHPGIYHVTAWPKKAGVVTMEAVGELISKLELKKEWLKYKLKLGEYPK